MDLASDASDDSIESPPHRRHLRAAIELGSILLLALALRLTVYVGLALGDDFSYADLVLRILDYGYPELGERSVFVARPLWLALLASSVAIFGWSEVAFVLPVLVSSLVGVAAAWWLARRLAGPLAGAMAGLSLAALFPADLVHATTLTNDLVGSALAAIGAVLGLVAFGLGDTGPHARRTRIALAGLAGVFVGATVAVKLSFAILFAPLVLASITWSLARGRVGPGATSLVAGWLLAQIAISLFFFVMAGDPIGHLRVEWTFNRENQADPAQTAERLAFYPARMLGAAVSGHPGFRYSEYGAFFLLWLVAAGIALSDRCARQRIGWCLAWALAPLLMLQFWPITLSGTYIPIHRLPRFLLLIAVPSAVVIGVSAPVVARWRLPWRLLAWSGLLAAVTISGISTWRMAETHRDSMLDPRIASQYASHFPGTIIADRELCERLQLASRFTLQSRCLEIDEWFGRNATNATRVAGSSVDSSVMAFTGGSRRPELDPAFAARFTNDPRLEDWAVVAKLDSETRPWRHEPLTIRLGPLPFEEPATATSGSRSSGSRPTTADSLAPAPLEPRCRLRDSARTQWRLVDELDLGNRHSERAHGYRIERESWQGVRAFPYPNGRQVRDSGRAFLGAHEFELTIQPDIRAGADTRTDEWCLVKRVDAGVRDQRSRWFIAHEPIGEMVLPTEDSAGFRDLSLGFERRVAVPGPLRFREELVSSEGDVNGFRVELYRGVAVDPGGRSSRERDGAEP